MRPTKLTTTPTTTTTTTTKIKIKINQITFRSNATFNVVHISHVSNAKRSIPMRIVYLWQCVRRTFQWIWYKAECVCWNWSGRPIKFYELSACVAECAWTQMHINPDIVTSGFRTITVVDSVWFGLLWTLSLLGKPWAGLPYIANSPLALIRSLLFYF